MESNYKCTIKESSRELTAKEKVMFKDITDALSLDVDEEVVIKVSDYVLLSIHNDKVEPSDYEKICIISEGGEKYVTGSISFISKFKEIMEDMADCGEEWELKVYKSPSKNYQGRGFITCSVI